MHYEQSTEDILMIVKTYPTPSATYGELVCTAGIRLSDEKWVRVYPYPFRLLGEDHRFEKWGVLSMPLIRASSDPRPDSYNLVDADQIVQKRVIPTGDAYWSPRMPIIRRTALPSVQEFQKQMLSEDKAIWGPSILPVPATQGTAKFRAQFVGDEWDKASEVKLAKAKDLLQQNMFAPEEVKNFFQTLRKIPYRFYLSFEDAIGERYEFSILDWEIASLWRNSRKSSKSDEEALEKMRWKLEEQMFAQDRETYVVLGSMHHRYKRRDLLAIDSIIWPKKSKLPPQPSLFDTTD